LSKKSEKISDKFLVLLASRISSDFSSEFLIGTQFKKSVEFPEVQNFCQNSENFSGFLLVGLSPGMYFIFTFFLFQTAELH
jgi:hypothetical protein